MNPPTFDDAKASADDFFDRTCPKWYFNRAKLMEVFLAGFTDRTVDATNLGPVPMIKLEQTTLRDGDRCIRQDTYVFTKYVNTLRTGRKCHILCGDVRETAFVLGYLKLTGRITRDAAGRSVADYLKPNIVKEITKELAPLLGGVLERRDIDQLIDTVEGNFDHYSQVHKEANLLLDWFGRCVGTWTVTDELVKSELVEIMRRTYLVEVKCDKKARRLPSGVGTAPKSSYLLPSPDQQEAVGRLAERAISQPVGKPDTGDDVRVVLDDIAADTAGLVAQTRKRDNFRLTDQLRSIDEISGESGIDDIARSSLGNRFSTSRAR